MYCSVLYCISHQFPLQSKYCNSHSGRIEENIREPNGLVESKIDLVLKRLDHIFFFYITAQNDDHCCVMHPAHMQEWWIKYTYSSLHIFTEYILWLQNTTPAAKVYLHHHIYIEQYSGVCVDYPDRGGIIIAGSRHEVYVNTKAVFGEEQIFYRGV